jgi:hypothetical protein
MSVLEQWRKRTHAPGYWRNLGLFALGVALAGIVALAI